MAATTTTRRLIFAILGVTTPSQQLVTDLLATHKAVIQRSLECLKGFQERDLKLLTSLLFYEEEGTTAIKKGRTT